MHLPCQNRLILNIFIKLRNALHYSMMRILLPRLYGGNDPADLRGGIQNTAKAILQSQNKSITVCLTMCYDDYRNRHAVAFYRQNQGMTWLK